jgi:hypothetical protein
MQRAVHTVARNMQVRAIETELAPRIQALKKRYRNHPDQLKEAVVDLVSHTVTQHVDSAFKNDPGVKRSVAAAIRESQRAAAEKAKAAPVAKVKAAKRPAKKVPVQVIRKSYLPGDLPPALKKLVPHGSKVVVDAKKLDLPPESAETIKKDGEIRTGVPNSQVAQTSTTKVNKAEAAAKVAPPVAKPQQAQPKAKQAKAEAKAEARAQPEQTKAKAAAKEKEKNPQPQKAKATQAKATEKEGFWASIFGDIEDVI